jgi:hypothetical protein
MDLRSPFWDLKVKKAGGAFAAEKSQTLALEKPDLKSFSDFRKKSLCKSRPCPTTFLLVPKGFEKCQPRHPVTSGHTPMHRHVPAWRRSPAKTKKRAS